jgi:hypothetical protein
VEIAQAANGFCRSTHSALSRIRGQLEVLVGSGAQIAIWGGTGKSAAFINRYGLDAQRFPTVVDSDVAKHGTFVPGSGQEIRARDWLKDHPVDVIIIPPQWRAFDIITEMERADIRASQVLVEHDGSLIDYFRNPDGALNDYLRESRTDEEEIRSDDAAKSGWFAAAR